MSRQKSEELNIERRMADMLSELRPIYFGTDLIFPPMNLSTRETHEKHQSRIKEVFQKLRSEKGIDFDRVDVGVVNGPHLMSRRGSGCVRSYAFLRDRIRARDEQTERTHEEFAQEVAEVAGVSLPMFSIPVIIIQSCVIRAIAKPHGYDDARDFLFHHGLGLSGQRVVQEFGRPAAIAGLRITFPPRPKEPNEHRVRVESFARDPSMLFLEVSSIFHKNPVPAGDPARIVTNFQSCYKFLEDKVAPFVDSLTETDRT